MTLQSLNTYIDTCLIDEYADKSSSDYTLDLDSLPQHEISNLLARVMQEDTSLRETILNGLQEMINERLPEFEASEQNRRGQRLVRLTNGDQFLTRSAA